MLNIHDYISNNKYFKTFQVNDLLIVEYKCMSSDDAISFWTHYNYFAYILSGETKYISGIRQHKVYAGDAIFVKKGTYVAQRYSVEDYCALIIFISDDFIKKVAEKYLTSSFTNRSTKRSIDKDQSILTLAVDESLNTYFHSMLSYFQRDVAPASELLKIKVEELLLNIFTSAYNQGLAACLRDIRECGKVSLREVMETSFMYPMSLEEYARLCARSLSTFKSDFYDIYKTSPGKWLIRARLQYAKTLIETTGDSVNDIAFKSGFKNTAHFVKVFKEAYKMPPHQYRLHELVA